MQLFSDSCSNLSWVKKRLLEQSGKGKRERKDVQ
jgi:hypothetical protein